MIKRKSIVILAVATILVVAASCMNKGANRSNSLKALYEEIDEEISHSDKYKAEKEARIDHLKQDLVYENEPHERLRAYNNLIAEYEAFVCDSALKYVEEARQLAETIGDEREQHRLLIKKADIASHAGLFKEAHEMLGGIERSELDTALLTDLYSAYCNLYQYESVYLPEGEYTDKSRELREVYIDSLMSVCDASAFTYLTNWTEPEIKQGNFEEVRKALEENLAKYRPGTRQYSIIASTMAHMYQAMGKPAENRRYLALTVISDLKGAVKENMAMRELATLVFEDGDIDRANHYLKVSLDDASFYAARMSDAQSSRMLPVIDRAFYAQQKKHQLLQKLLIYITSFLLLLAVAAIVVYMRQMRLVKSANRKVRQSNEELSEMSKRLQEVNGELERSNNELKNSNRTAQEYAGLFMEFCSITISNLQKYHLMLRNLAMQGNVKTLLKKLDSSDVSNETFKDFYNKFDEAILNIYPQFVEKVNELLKPEERIVLKSDEKLNTELRILALIKIGITDSDKISQFLRCSISTIYTYRSKLKKRSLHPEDFEKNLIFE